MTQSEKTEADSSAGEGADQKEPGALPSVREMAAAMVSAQIRELEARAAQAYAAMEILQYQLQAARMRAPFDVERLAKSLSLDTNQGQP